jgi:hypothetical protein
MKEVAEKRRDIMEGMKKWGRDGNMEEEGNERRKGGKRKEKNKGGVARKK